ncbi:uncharacterized protein B0I36DRAFT_420836 [Microdochium trichocladiopsis]|uniref:Rhodopsin domain-containing protein n=1 Tax=Microdochium trichocladiopsis TaxID=1682393 RepID=A0A9P8YFP5_9PEZI|nr:uncharacterized protein B0I36DRAFT_420836 [Microdochium trichocladiopsis]KAH7038374.1 hypothetical protein B0I36DRAFT_420836 [Microdochium trichocladiopsis]
MSLPSALYGQPPNTVDDYFIVKGLYRALDIEDAEPMAGFFFAPHPPPGAVRETRVLAVIIGCVFVILGIIIPTTARLVLRARRSSVLCFGWDDWTILLAAITALSYPITHIILPLVGATCRHVWDMTYQEINYGSYGGAATRTIYYVAVGLIKLSIALFVRRMAHHASRRWQILIDVFIVTVIAYILVTLFWNVFSCNPAPAQWDLAFRGRAAIPPVCGDVALRSHILGGVHVGQGIILLAIPIVVLLKFQLDTAKKIRLYIVWIVGAVQVASALLRELRPSTSKDTSWDYTEILIWTSIDLTLGILLASLPVMDGLLAGNWHKTATGMASDIMSPQRSRNNSDPKQQQPTKGGGTTTVYTTRQKNRSLRNIGTTLGGGGGGSSRLKRTESSESIMQGERRSEDAAMEMGILRTQEIRVLYSMAAERARAEAGSGTAGLDEEDFL